MAEIREIEKDETPLDGEWVLVEARGNWSYVANGSVRRNRENPFATPQAFTTLDDALNASLAWAELNDVPVVYVRKS